METYQLIIIAEVAIIIILTGILIGLLSKRAKNKKIVLEEKNKRNIQPLEDDDRTIIYANNKLNDRGNVITVGLRVEAPLSTKKYLIEIVDKVSIGSSKRNEIEVNDLGVEQVHCILFQNRKHLFIKNEEIEILTQIKRKGQIIKVDKTPLNLEVGDSIIIGNTEIEIESTK